MRPPLKLQRPQRKKDSPQEDFSGIDVAREYWKVAEIAAELAKLRGKYERGIEELSSTTRATQTEIGIRIGIITEQFQRDAKLLIEQMLVEVSQSITSEHSDEQKKHTAKLNKIAQDALDYVHSLKPQKGERGDDGRDGLDGRDGVSGKDGKDGSPDTPEQLFEKLNSKENVLNTKVIKDLDRIIDNIRAEVRSASSQIMRGGGTTIYISATEPEDPYEHMLWLDIS